MAEDAERRNTSRQRRSRGRRRTGASSSSPQKQRTGARPAPSQQRGNAKRTRRTRSRAHAPEAEELAAVTETGEGENGNGQKELPVPPLAPGNMRIIPLGGVEEIGRNMTVFEYGDDIIVIDCGFQFREEATPGIDYILPNTRYLEERKDKIRAIIVTHGHLDHIGGIPYVIEQLGFPPIYSRQLTTVMIKKRQEEFPYLPKLDIREVEKEESISVGKLKVEFFEVTHTIPDSMGVIINTPLGKVVFTGDLKLDHKDGVPKEREEKEFARFSNDNVLLLCADSTNVEKPGFSIPEEVVHQNIEQIICETQSRLIIGTFASQLERIIKIIEIAEKYSKKVVIEGRSMKSNIEIVRYLKMLNTKKGTIIGVEEMDSHPPEKIVVLATGAQGDEFSALMRMANKTHRFLKIQKNDTVLLSSSIIPGNERAVQKLKDNLSRQGARIIHYQMADVHASGHANHDETLWIHRKVKPRFFMPMHGYHYMLRVHADIAQEAGILEKNLVIPDNSAVVEIQDEGKKMVRRKENAPSHIRMVDGFSVGDIQEVVIRDRKMLAQEGMFVIIASVNLKTGKLRKSPDIISRGFIYLRESQELLQQTRIIIKKSVENSIAGMNPINFEYVKTNLTDDVSRFLYQKTNKRPIVIPVILGV